jgi:hypothetical protein
LGWEAINRNDIPVIVFVAVILLWAVVKQRKVIHTAGAESSQSPKNV